MVITNQKELELFVRLITNSQEIPQRLIPIYNLYQKIKSAVRFKGKQIMDISIFGKRFYSDVSGVTEEEYIRSIDKLAMYEALINRQDWPEFHTLKERQLKKIEELKKDFSSDSEKTHFTEEFKVLGDQAEDILGSITLALMPLAEVRRKIKKRTERAK